MPANRVRFVTRRGRQPLAGCPPRLVVWAGCDKAAIARARNHYVIHWRCRRAWTAWRGNGDPARSCQTTMGFVPRPPKRPVAGGRAVACAHTGVKWPRQGARPARRARL